MTDPISRIEAALARLGAEHEPPPGWEARVLAATVDRKPSRWRWWWISLPAVATLAFALWMVSRPTAAGNPLLAFVATADDIKLDVKEAGLRRGSLSRGDVLTARATHSDVHGALWIYRDGALVLACPGDQGCWSVVGQTIAALRLALPGEHKIVSLTSKTEIPAPRGDYGTDVAAAIAAGATPTEEPPEQVH